MTCLAKTVKNFGHWFNLRYVVSPVGMLKIVTLVTLFCSGLALFNGHCNAEYISPANGEEATPEQRCNAGPKRPINPATGKELTCPQTGLAHASVFFIGIPFVVSLILLLVQLFIQFDSSTFKLIHFGGHIAAGILVMIGAVMSLAFATEGFSYYQCNDVQCLNESRLCKDYHKICLELRTNHLQPFSFVVAGTFALIGGAAYIITGIAIKQYEN